MSYTWTNGEVITAEKLNQTGGGGDCIIEVGSSSGAYTFSKTFAEVKEAYDSGNSIWLENAHTGGPTIKEMIRVPLVTYQTDRETNELLPYKLEFSGLFGNSNSSLSIWTFSLKVENGEFTSWTRTSKTIVS